MSTHYATSDHTVEGNPDCNWYELQVIDGIMSKPGKITHFIVWITGMLYLPNRVFISKQAIQLVVSEFNT